MWLFRLNRILLYRISLIKVYALLKAVYTGERFHCIWLCVGFSIRNWLHFIFIEIAESQRFYTIVGSFVKFRIMWSVCWWEVIFYSIWLFVGWVSLENCLQFMLIKKLCKISQFTGDKILLNVVPWWTDTHRSQGNKTHILKINFKLWLFWMTWILIDKISLIRRSVRLWEVSVVEKFHYICFCVGFSLDYRVHFMSIDIHEYQRFNSNIYNCKILRLLKWSIHCWFCV